MMDPAWCSLCQHPERIVRREWAESHTIVDVPHLSECNACGEEIMWVRTEKGKSMPIDAEPGGNADKARFVKLRTMRVDGKIVGVVRYLWGRELEDNTRPLYASHFDTCPRKAAS